MEQDPQQLMNDALESSDQLLKTALDDNRRRRAIKNMALPIMWTQDDLYERKILFAGMRQRKFLNAFREIRIRLLHKCKHDNIVLLVSSIVPGGGSSFFAFNLAATFALDQHKTALYVDCNPYGAPSDRYCATPVEQGLMHLDLDKEVLV